MCGIVGYIGKRDISSILLVGLERLSYRGYDSAGISVICNDDLSTWKKVGKISELSRVVDNLNITGHIGIGHTRWATHGIPNDINSHPHISSDKKISVVHNGIIENFIELKKELSDKGVLFRSDTDSEVIAHLIHDNYQECLFDAVKKSIKKLQGAFAIAVISEYNPNEMIVARSGSPLIIGKGNEENFISSDLNALITHTKEILYLKDQHLAVLSMDDIRVETFDGEIVRPEFETIKWSPLDSEKLGYEHFMLKEIYEQPTVIRRICSKYIKKNKIVFKHIKNLSLDHISRFSIQACGTSWHAGMIGKYLIEKYSRVLTEVDISSEFRYRQMIAQGNDVTLAISQSGETADTLAGLREAKSHFFRVLSFVNSKNSSIDRESDGVIYSHSGQEIGVASTKNYLAQISTLYLFTVFYSLQKKVISEEKAIDMIDQLNKIPSLIEQLLNQADSIKKLADKYYLSNQFMFIGRGMNYPSALEGALKLKEISYIHATGYAAGELKHGPIALIDSKLPIVCIAPNTPTYDKMISNIEEIKSRKGKLIIVATEGNKEVKKYTNDIMYIPECPEDLTPLLVAVPLQLFAYYIAINLDCDVDQPRNLAKSVTVE